MSPVGYTHTVLKRRVRLVGALAFVKLEPGAEAILLREHLESMAERWPNGALLLHPPSRDGAKRQVRLRWHGCKGKRLSVARIVLSLMGEGDQAHRQARFRDRNPLNLTSDNLSLTERGPLAGSTDTHQETARRGWLRSHGRNSDGRGGGDAER